MSSSPRTKGHGQHQNGNGATSTLPAGPLPAAAATAVAHVAAPGVPALAVVPQHVAIIMDGNGRWAKGRGMMRVAGHRSGVEAVRSCVRAAGEFGVKYLTLYAFSVENWRRPRAEIAALMLLLEQFLREELEELMSNNVRLQAIGRLSDLPKSVRDRLDASIEATSGNTGLTLILALSYSGRVEIIEAVRSIAAEVRSGRLNPEAIDDTVLESHLYTSPYPDPDLLIRTSGEMRLSNFLLWQLSYTEIHVTATLWPDFRRDQFVHALQDFASRQRRYGRV
ncbi:MAG: isoprenyl transferase [Candidatus Methylacidiphilales bacterium]